MNNKEICIQQVEEIVKEIGPISLGADNEIEAFISPRISKMVSLLSKSVMETDFYANRSDFTHSEWHRMVQHAFEEALVPQSNEMRTKKNAEAILKVVINRLHDWIDEIPEREYVFACHLCNIHDFEALSIGPVRLETKYVWLSRLRRNGNISKVSSSRIERSWRGDQLRKRKASEDEMRETEILDAIGKSEFVCSVAVPKIGAEVGSQKALTAARLATTVISLVWRKPSLALDVITLPFDRQPYLQNYLVAIPDRLCGWQSSWSYLPGGVTYLKKEDWAKLRMDYDEIWHCAGEVIRCFIHGEDFVEQPKMLNSLFWAILWFHEGCREQVDPIAIVKFCSSMEALAGGERMRGIQNLIKARLIVKDKDKLCEQIKKIYIKGRSQIIHGKNDKLGYELSNTRNHAEDLARKCLISCIQFTIKYRAVDDPRLFSKPM